MDTRTAVLGKKSKKCCSKFIAEKHAISEREIT